MPENRGFGPLGGDERDGTDAGDVRRADGRRQDDGAGCIQQRAEKAGGGADKRALSDNKGRELRDMPESRRVCPKTGVRSWLRERRS